MAGVRVDAHQHFWNLETGRYPWLTPAAGPIYRTYAPGELAPHLHAAGIHKTVLVQAADSYEDTEAMLRQADEHDWIGGVVGWVPLLRPAEAARVLDRYLQHPAFKGVRHLIHDEQDPDWVVQAPVIEGLKLLAQRGLTFDVVAVFPNHLKHVPALAEAVPDLTMIIDHLAKPPIRDRQMQPWSEQMAAAARYPNVYAKVSGLNTAADPHNWSAADLKPYIDEAIAHFGADRLLFGSDWPVCELAGDYAQVWTETNRALAGRTDAEREAILGGTAARVYHI